MEILVKEQVYDDRVLTHPSKQIRFGRMTHNSQGQKRSDGGIDLDYVDHPTWVVTFKNVELAPPTGPAPKPGSAPKPLQTVKGDVTVAISDTEGRFLFAVESAEDLPS